ncbi:MAG: cyclic pyranopterin monophosphate synthase MoaC [Bacteroidales bacterium]
MAKLTHTDESGRAHMVHTGEKPVQHRTATASGRIDMQPETLKLVADNMMKKEMSSPWQKLRGYRQPSNAAPSAPLCHNIVLDQVQGSP